MLFAIGCSVVWSRSSLPDRCCCFSWKFQSDGHTDVQTQIIGRRRSTDKATGPPGSFTRERDETPVIRQRLRIFTRTWVGRLRRMISWLLIQRYDDGGTTAALVLWKANRYGYNYYWVNFLYCMRRATTVQYYSATADRAQPHYTVCSLVRWVPHTQRRIYSWWYNSHRKRK